MSSLFSYMTDMEYECAIEHKKFVLESTKFENAFRLAELNHQVRINDIDTKVFVENADDSTLEYLYSNEMQIYTESVKEVWDKFVKWVKGIINAIFKKSDEIKNADIDDDTEETYKSEINIDKACDIGERIISELNTMKTIISDKGDEVSNSINKNSDAVNNLTNKVDNASDKIDKNLKSIDKDIKNNNPELAEKKRNTKRVAFRVGGLALAAFGAKATLEFSKCKVKTIYKLPEVLRKSERLKGVSKKLADSIEKFTAKIKKDSDTESMTVAEKIYSEILNVINGAINSIRSKVKSAVKDAVEDTADKIAAKTGEAVDGAIEKSKQAAKNAKDQATQKAKESVAAAADEAHEIIKDTKKKAEETANKAKETAANAKENVKDMVKDVVSDIKDSMPGGNKDSDGRRKIKIPPASEWDAMKPADRANELSSIFAKKNIEIKRENIIALARLSHDTLIDKFKDKNVFFESESIWEYIIKEDSSDLTLDDLMVESSINDYTELMELAKLL